MFCDLRRRRERRFRIGTQCEIDDFRDEELCAHYRFRWESILFITNLVAGDISRNTRRNHALNAAPSSFNCPQVLRQWKFPTSYRRHLRCRFVNRFQGNYRCVSGLNHETASLYQVAFNKRRMCHN